uniref:Uncharacterized protein n=1 Tax=Accipiter nisus TaxID=211598 RepID=A0A8B9N705_9AVES
CFPTTGEGISPNRLYKMHAFLVHTIKFHLIYSLCEPIISHEALSSVPYWNETHIFYTLMLFMSCALFHESDIVFVKSI